MILEVNIKYMYEVDKELYDSLDSEEFEEAIKDGRVKYLDVKISHYEDGELMHVETVDSEEIREYLDEELKEA